MNKATQSKINWTAALIALVNIAAALDYIPADMEMPVISLVNTIGPVLIVVFRTWYTGGK